MEFKRNNNTDYLFYTLTSPKISQISGGKIPQMTPAQAAGLIGSWIVETGDPTLMNLDVIERQARAGRGLSQYTAARRVPYDRAAAQAQQAGQDINSAQWQLQYFADEYAGKYDQNGRSLSGWTGVFGSLPQNLSPGDYADYITGSFDEQRGYFRPSVPHTDRRKRWAESVFGAYNNPNLGIPGQPQQPRYYEPPKLKYPGAI